MGTINKILILHGWTTSIDKWNSLIQNFKDRKINFELLKIPGLTESINKVWTIDDYVEWLKKIADKEKGKVILFGHSNGGRVILNFANKYPEKVNKLILMDSAGIYHNDFGIKLKRFVFKSLAKIGKKISSSKILKAILYKLAREGDYNKSNPIMKQTMVNILNSDKSLDISKISIPTLIIWGENDKITPISDAKIMYENIKNSKLYIVKNARHSPHFTNAEEVANIILANIDAEN